MTRETMTLQKEELNPLKDKASFSLNIINEGLCQLKKSATTTLFDLQE